MAVKLECTFNLSRFFKSSCMKRMKEMNFIEHSTIPDDIWVAVRVAGTSTVPEASGSRAEARIREKAAGRSLITDMVAERFGRESLLIESAENQKPSAIYNDKPLQISIAHTRSLICGAVSERKKIGIDIESVNRQVDSRLRKRILHKEESNNLPEIKTLQIWTIKEAALKWLGSGLRTDMNSICIVSAENPLFRVMFPGGQQVAISSFEHRGHWVSIAYDAE